MSLLHAEENAKIAEKYNIKIEDEKLKTKYMSIATEAINNASKIGKRSIILSNFNDITLGEYVLESIIEELEKTYKYKTEKCEHLGMYDLFVEW